MDKVYKKLFSSEDNAFFDSCSNSIAEIVKQFMDLNSLYLLCQMSYGILHSTLTEILDKKGNEWFQSKKEFFCDKNEPTAIILTSKLEDLNGELLYTPTENLLYYVNNKLLNDQKRVPYQCLCIGKYATITRNLVRSYNIKEYKCLAYDEFSSLVDDGIWACNTKYPGITNENDLPLQSSDYVSN